MILNKLHYFLLAFCFSFVAFAEDDVAREPAQSGSQLYIKVGEAKTKKSLIAMPAFQFIGSSGVSPNYHTIGSELFKVTFNDLLTTAYFQFIDQKAFLEDPNKTSALPSDKDPRGFKFQSWSAIGAEFLIRATFSIAGDQITFDTFLYHVPRAQLIMGKKYKASTSSARKIAHMFANDILKILTGKEGMFLSKLVVTSDRAGGQAREVYTMDWDGSSPERITNHRSIALSPNWSPDNRRISYTAVVKHKETKRFNHDLFVYEVNSGRRTLVSYRSGLNSGSAFDSDGKSIYFTNSTDGNSDIYKINLDGEIIRRLTAGPRGAMNVEAAVSPDGRQIAFSSDRSGQPMIYVMNSDGSNIRRITYAGKYNSSPSWSPDGKKLAFAGQDNDHFDIFVVNVDGTGMIRLTQARKPNGRWANNENPTFSPDGRFVAYSSDRTKNYQIYISTADGTEERRITFDNSNYFSPKWSQNFE